MWVVEGRSQVLQGYWKMNEEQLVKKLKVQCAVEEGNDQTLQFLLQRQIHVEFLPVSAVFGDPGLLRAVTTGFDKTPRKKDI